MKNYFTVEEICYSSIAKKHKIKNVPDHQNILDNINTLIMHLNALRESWGSALTVSSGYRCSALNKLVGGSKTSSHCTGYAVDIVPKDINDFEKFADFCREYFKHNDFDQCIKEEKKSAKWMHISVDPRNRRQFLKTKDGKLYLVWNQK